MDTPTLTDGIVTLRRPTINDLDVVVEAVRSSHDELGPWMPWAQADYGREGFEYFLNQLEGGDEAFLIHDPSGRLVGTAGLNDINGLNLTANLGYWGVTGTHGEGWVSRAARLVAIDGFERHGLQRIEIVMAVENRPSQRVAERIGAQAEGRRKSALRLHDLQHDVFVHVLLPTDLEWLRRQSAG